MTGAVTQFYIFIRTACGNSWNDAVSCIDSNGDGIVTKGELRTFLSNSDTFEYQPADFEDIWHSIDKHTKGNIGNGNVRNLNAIDSSEGAAVQRQIQRYGILSEAVDRALEGLHIDSRVLERIGGEDKLKYRAITNLANNPSIMNNIENLRVEDLVNAAKQSLSDSVKELIFEALTNNSRYTCYTQGLTGKDGQPYSLQDDNDLKTLINNYLNTVSLANIGTNVIDNVEKIIQAYLKSAELGNFDNPDMNGLENSQWNNNTKLNELQFANITRKYNNALVISQLISIEPFDKFKNNQTKLAQVIKEFMVSKQNEWKTLTQPVNFNQLYNVNDDNIREELKSFDGFITALEELNNPTTGGGTQGGDNYDSTLEGLNINYDKYSTNNSIVTYNEDDYKEETNGDLYIRMQEIYTELKEQLKNAAIATCNKHGITFNENIFNQYINKAYNLAKNKHYSCTYYSIPVNPENNDYDTYLASETFNEQGFAIDFVDNFTKNYTEWVRLNNVTPNKAPVYDDIKDSLPDNLKSREIFVHGLTQYGTSNDLSNCKKAIIMSLNTWSDEVSKILIDKGFEKAFIVNALKSTVNYYTSLINELKDETGTGNVNKVYGSRSFGYYTYDRYGNSTWHSGETAEYTHQANDGQHFNNPVSNASGVYIHEERMGLFNKNRFTIGLKFSQVYAKFMSFYSAI